MQISCAVTAQLISAFVFATRIVQSLYFLNPNFQASSYLLWLHSPVCVGLGRKPRRPVFSQRGSYATIGLSHPYHLDESTFLLRDIGNKFAFLFHFSMIFSSPEPLGSQGELIQVIPFLLPLLTFALFINSD